MNFLLAQKKETHVPLYQLAYWGAEEKEGEGEEAECAPYFRD